MVVSSPVPAASFSTDPGSAGLRPERGARPPPMGAAALVLLARTR
jgi:hypothetical protein